MNFIEKILICRLRVSTHQIFDYFATFQPIQVVQLKAAPFSISKRSR